MSVIPDGYALTPRGRLRKLGPAWAEGAQAQATERLVPLREVCRKKADERLIAEFTVPGKVVGKGRPRFTRQGGGRAYTPAKTVAYEEEIATCARTAMGAAAPEEGPVRLTAAAYIAVPASYGKAKRTACLADELLPITRPDADDYLKAVLDAANGILWKDDSQVVDARVTKRYATDPGLHVRVERLA